jgi:hypothetical protein
MAKRIRKAKPLLDAALKARIEQGGYTLKYHPDCPLGDNYYSVHIGRRCLSTFGLCMFTPEQLRDRILPIVEKEIAAYERMKKNG